MSLNTAGRPSSCGDYLLFVPYNRVLRYRSVKPSSDQLRGAHIAQPPFMKSRVLLRFGVHVYRFAFHHSVGTALVDSFHRKKQYILHLTITPTPTPLISGSYGRYIYLHLASHNYWTCISYNFFIFCPICEIFTQVTTHIQLYFKHKKAKLEN